ncbi:hypothetical protein DAEQUDRAFT_107932 [Daedalea quercina L-15889]|uniref:Uncharacterized protein n=1 Tax=Daedalea quercina L-15889 TaxID=1314783 RepID=A0A165S2M8_9APHY|nr:hypothetical protein DAEQUDRAFT_107932 [Daedalea quercina L-15889]
MGRTRSSVYQNPRGRTDGWVRRWFATQCELAMGRHAVGVPTPYFTSLLIFVTGGITSASSLHGCAQCLFALSDRNSLRWSTSLRDAYLPTHCY